MVPLSTCPDLVESATCWNAGCTAAWEANPWQMLCIAHRMGIAVRFKSLSHMESMKMARVLHACSSHTVTWRNTGSIRRHFWTCSEYFLQLCSTAMFFFLQGNVDSSAIVCRFGGWLWYLWWLEVAAPKETPVAIAMMSTWRSRCQLAPGNQLAIFWRTTWVVPLLMKTATRNGTNQPVATCMRGGSYPTFWIRSNMECWPFFWNCELEVRNIALYLLVSMVFQV